jgi:hypothetical protein
MTCPQCGALPRSSAAFCTACGASLVEQHEPTAGRPTPVKEMVGPERAAWIDSVWGAVETTDR